MKGIEVTRFGGPEVLEFKEIAAPIAGTDQVLIEVRGASVNFADTQARTGKYHLGKKPPYIPGIDVAGIVLECGADVTTIKPGDHVIAFPLSGSYAEKAVANQNLTFVIPDSIDFKVAAACPIVAGTVTHMLTQIGCIESSESLLVHAAAGGVGSTALQIAKYLGITNITGSTSSPWKKDRIIETGADAVIDYSDDYREKINELTGGKGVDVILNPLGGETISRDLQCLAPFGRLILFGKLNEGLMPLSPADLYTTNKSVIGFSFGHYRRFRPDEVNDTMKLVIDLLKNKLIDVQIGACFPLEGAEDAHRAIEHREIFGKIVLLP